jgi:hypothetical protein
VPALRSSIELLQPYEKFKPFSLTTSGSTATTVLTVSDYMIEANKITIIVDRDDLYVNIGSDATTDGSSMLVPAGTGYTEMGVSFSGTISVIRANQANGRIIGAIWGR